MCQIVRQPIFLSVFVCLFTINNSLPTPSTTFQSENYSPESEFHPQKKRNGDSNSTLQAVGCYDPCFCTEDSIHCKFQDTLKGLEPIRNPAKYSEINIINQQGFTILRAADLAQFVNLQSLTVTNSGLIDIEDDAFVGKNKLSYLNLESNRLSFFNLSFIRHMEDGAQVILDGNPLRCTCSLLFLHNRINNYQDGDIGGNDNDDDGDGNDGDGDGNDDDGDDNYGNGNDDYGDGGFDKDLDDDIENDDDEYDDGGDDDDLQEGTMCWVDSKYYTVTEFPGSDACVFPEAEVTTNLISTNNSEITVTCSGLYSTNVTVRWVKPEGHDDVDVKVISGSEVTMTFRNVSAYSMGTFQCEVENENGFDVAEWDLLVSCEPIIENVVKLELYPDVALGYKVIGHPRPSIEWYKNGRLMVFHDNDSDVMHIQVDMEESYVVIGHLFLSAPFHVDGNFTIVATNSEGSANRTMTLNSEGGMPPERSDGSFSHGFKKIFNSKVAQSEDNKGQSLPTWVHIVLGVLIAILIVVIVILAMKYWKFRKHVSPGSLHGDFFKRRGSTNGSKRGKGLNQKGRSLERVRRSRLAAFCLDGPEGGRPVRRENIPLSNDHVVQNPNYEGSDGIVGDGESFGRGGFMDERCLLGMSAVPKIPSSDIECLQELGEGAFGLVYLGTLKMRDPVTKDMTRLPVAIKTVKDCHFENNRRDFDREATMLSGLKHENIVTLYGVSIDRQPHMIVLEYMEFGDLCNFLRTNGPDGEMLTPKITHHLFFPRPSFKRSLTPLDLLTVATQISRGGAYLAQQHFVHRDLATRNCLVGANLVVKIGDFGMSRDVYATDYYKVGSHLLMPVRWMPPESIMYKTFTIESDVWSFGVVLWEIYTFGKQPWYELSNTEVIQHVQQGNVMPCPSNCPLDVYSLMLKCWHKDPRERISLEKMYNQLDSILKQQQQPCDLFHQRQEVDHKRVTDLRLSPKRFTDLHPCITQGVRKDTPRPINMRPPTYLELIDS